MNLNSTGKLGRTCAFSYLPVALQSLQKKITSFWAGLSQASSYALFRVYPDTCAVGGGGGCLSSASRREGLNSEVSTKLLYCFWNIHNSPSLRFVAFGASHFDSRPPWVTLLSISISSQAGGRTCRPPVVLQRSPCPPLVSLIPHNHPHPWLLIRFCLTPLFPF